MSDDMPPVPQTEWCLDTPRLVLRPFRPDDVDALHAIWQEPEVGRFIDADGWPPRWGRHAAL